MLKKRAASMSSMIASALLSILLSISAYERFRRQGRAASPCIRCCSAVDCWLEFACDSRDLWSERTIASRSCFLVGSGSDGWIDSGAEAIMALSWTVEMVRMSEKDMLRNES